MNRRKIIVTGGIVAAGIVVGVFLIVGGRQTVNTPDDSRARKKIVQEGGRNAEAKTQEGEPQTSKGPHGGRLLTQGSFAIEVTIYEKGVPPEFRVYAYEAGKPLNPGEGSLRIELERLGAPPETIAFQAKQDYLLGDLEIVEPHSFAVRVMAEHKGQAYRWDYEQVEGRMRMDDATAQSAGVRIGTAGPAKIRSTLQLSGEIQFNQDHLAHVVPRLDGVVITMVELAGDGSCARLWFTAEGDDDRRAACEHIAGFLRSQLAESLGLKRTPELRFRRDPASRALAPDAMEIF